MTITLTFNELLTEPISRRSIFKGIGVAAAGSALFVLEGGLHTRERMPVGAIAPPQSMAAQPEVAAAMLVRTAFTALLGQTFQIAAGADALPPLRLAKVRSLSRSGATSEHHEHQFSLLFSGPLETPIKQNTYRFAHTGLGSFLLFIVPMMPDHDTSYYEAIFNQYQA